MIKLTLKQEVILDNTIWMMKEEWEEIYKNNLSALKELYSEDLSSFWEAIGEFDIIKKAEWID